MYKQSRKVFTVSLAHSICNLRFNVPSEIPVFFHNESNYDYHLS